MRPVRLSLQGFKSHEDKTEFDFSERSLFAIVGPMGAGKTTILDGISFALFAKTPKVQRTTKSLVCSTKESAEIELVFEAEGRTYTINRSIRNKGTPVHVLTDDAGEKVTGESAVTEAVEELLRLDFNAFRSSVLLAQNQFDEFFKARPDTRMKILKGVFRFDQLDNMRDAAKDHRNEYELVARELEGGLKEIPEDAVEQISKTKAELAEIDGRVTAMEKIGPAEQKLLAKIGSADEDLEAARTALAELEELSGDLPTAKVLSHLVAAEEQIAAPLEKTTKHADEVKIQHKKVREALTSLEGKLGKETALVALLERATRWQELSVELDEAEKAVPETRTLLDSAKKSAASATSAEKKAGSALEQLEDERLQLHTKDAAHGLRGGLKPGDTCPVCEQTIAAVPKGKAPAALDTIDDRIAAAKTVRTDCVAAARTAAEGYLAAKHSAETAADKTKVLAGQVKKIETELVGALGTTKDPLAEVKVRTDKVRDAHEARDRLDNDLSEALDELEGLKSKDKEFQELRAGIYADLAHVASALKQPRLDRKANAVVLSSAAETFFALLSEQIDASNKRIEELGNVRVTIETEMRRLHEGVGLEPGQTVAAALGALQETRGTLGAQIAKLEGDIERSKDLIKKLKKVRAQIKIYDILYSDLANTKFIDFLLEDKRRLLSELASAQLRDMTGRYRFDDVGKFNVIDEFNADNERGVDSLSGGETFLASLALALGLAESVTRHGGRLQCFFLDEGFGSLDADALQKALDGIERIATEDRLIGLVSHVQGVAERVIDKIELDRDDDGMTIVKQPAMPALKVVD